MNGYLLLMTAIVGEVFGSTMLKASNGFKRLFPIFGIIVGYGLAFYLLSLSLKTIPLGMAYAIWSGVGTALTVLISVLLWGEVLSILKVIGIVLIIGGVIVLNTSENGETATVPSD